MKIELNTSLAKKIWTLAIVNLKPDFSRKIFENCLKKNDYERITVEREKDINYDELFSDNIKKSIAYLTELELDGYERIEERWFGYENNYFVAIKIEKETDDEFAERIAKDINLEIEREMKEKEKKDEVEAKIIELKKELNRLEQQKGK